MPSRFAIYPSLEGMPVIISGGASGIGETLVREFAAQGAKVGFVDIATAQGEALAASLVAEGRSVRFSPCDIRDVTAYRAAIAGFEVGKRDLRGDTIRKLCEALGVQVVYKIDGTEITGP